MQVLVTGGSGFLGAWIVKRLAKSGHQIRIFDVAANKSLVAEIAGAAAESVEWRTGDIIETGQVHDAAEGCDAIVHLAGILTPDCKDDPIRGAKINLIGTLNVFETARRRGIKRIVYTSSAAVYGPTDGHTPCPDTHYGAFKLACEGSARAYWEDHQLGSIGFRPYVVYGPGRATGLTAGPSLACRAAASELAYTIPYSGSAGLVYIEDVAAAYKAALLREPDGAHVFNMPGEVASNDQVITEIRRVIPGAKIDIAGPALQFTPDIEQGDINAVLPGLQQTGLGKGIRQTIAFHRTALAK
jgi:nucleoside-diphosphate-sugar epimerase